MFNGTRRNGSPMSYGREFPLVSLMLIAGVASANRTVRAQQSATRPSYLRVLPPTPLHYPERRPAQPRGGMPPSCREFTGAASAHPHWEQQTTVLSRVAIVNGRPQRVADVAVTMVGRHDLNSVTLDEFAAAPQAFAQVDFDGAHNGLPAGRYCLVLQYEPTVGDSGGSPFDRTRWHTFLYDLSTPDAPARAVVPFLSRQPAPSDLATPRPYPPVRFDFVVVNLPGVPNRARSRIASSNQMGISAGYISAWGPCGAGCCTSGLEGLQRY